jgi:CBS domain-containing protein
MEALTAGLTVSDATDTDPATITSALAVETLLLEDAERGGQGVYPVVERGQLVGFAFVSRLRRPLRRKRQGERVGDALVPVETAPSLRPEEPLIRAVERLEVVGSDGLPVMSSEDPTLLYGIVTRARVLDRLRARHAITQARGGSAPSDARG